MLAPASRTCATKPKLGRSLLTAGLKKMSNRLPHQTLTTARVHTCSLVPKHGPEGLEAKLFKTNRGPRYCGR